MPPSPLNSNSSAGPTLRQTHNEQDSKGEWFGFEGRTAVVPLSILFLGLFFASLLYTFLGAPLVPTFAVCLAPGLLAAAVTLLFVNHKPPGYLSDLMRSRFGTPGASRFGPTTASPYSDENDAE